MYMYRCICDENDLFRISKNGTEKCVSSLFFFVHSFEIINLSIILNLQNILLS